MAEAPKNKLEKINDQEYKVTTEFEHVKRVDRFGKDWLRKNYEEGEQQRIQYTEQLKVVNKKISEAEEKGLKEDAELQKFIELATRANEYNEYQKNVGVRDGILHMLKNLELQKHDIEFVAPELKRKLKK